MSALQSARWLFCFEIFPLNHSLGRKEEKWDEKWLHFHACRAAFLYCDSAVHSNQQQNQRLKNSFEGHENSQKLQHYFHLWKCGRLLDIEQGVRIATDVRDSLN